MPEIVECKFGGVNGKQQIQHLLIQTPEEVASPFKVSLEVAIVAEVKEPLKDDQVEVEWINLNEPHLSQVGTRATLLGDSEYLVKVKAPAGCLLENKLNVKANENKREGKRSK